MGIARQIRRYGFWSSEGFFGIDDPVDFAKRLEECIESGLVDKVRVIAEEPQFPGVMQFDQPFQKETPVQSGQNTHGEEKVLSVRRST